MPHVTRWLTSVLVLLPLFFGCGGSRTPTVVSPTPTPTPQPTAPEPPPAAPVARLAVNVDGRGLAKAIQSFSTVTFDASGSSGVGLRYGLDFGDGSGADAPTASHVYDAAGRTYKGRLIVTDSLGRTDSVSVDVSVVSIDGSWSHSFYNTVANRYENRQLILTQSGRTISGEYRHPESWLSPLRGELRPGRDVSLNLTDGTISFSGGANGAFNGEVTLMTVTMRGGSADGQIMSFSHYGY